VVEGKGLLQRASCFGEPAAQEPVPGQGVDDPECVVVVVVQRGVQGGAQVGGLGVQAPEPGPLVVAAKAWCRPFGEIGVVTAVPHPQPARFPRFGQTLQAVRCDALQQAIPGAVRRVRHHDQGAIHQPGQQPQHVQVILGADRLRGGQAAAVRGYRQPPQHQPFRLGEQLPAPVDDGPQGLLPRRGVAMPGDQQPEPVVEPGEELVHAQGPDAGRRQLQRQRNPVEPPAQPRDGLGVTLVEAETRRGRTGAHDEQLYGAGLRQRRYRPDDLAGQHEGFPAGHQDAQSGSGLEHLGGQLGDLVDQVLAVVKDQQHPAGTQRLGQQVGRVHAAVVPDAQDGQDRVRGRTGPGECGPGQLGQPGTVGEGVRRLSRRLQGQPRLAHAARPGEGHQPALVQQGA
jgi:hypothetical protein